MRMSIVGLAFSGKTSFFELLTKHGVDSAVSGKKGRNIGTVFVPDERLDHLTGVYEPKKQVSAALEFTDSQSLSTEGAGNSFSTVALEEIRRADTLCLVIQGFDTIPHPIDVVDPPRDLEFIHGELILNDLMTLEKRAEKLRKVAQISKKQEDLLELAAVDKAVAALEEERALRNVDLTENEIKALSGYQLMTLKPLLVVLNVGENEIAEMDALLTPMRERHPELNFTAMCAELENELAAMEPEDASEFMADLGIAEPAFSRIVQACLDLVGLQVFFTVGPDECRAWPIAKSSSAYDAAGAIHSDIQRGFIRASVMPYAVFAESPSPDQFKDSAVQQKKDYIMQDGDIVEFKFSVSK